MNKYKDKKIVSLQNSKKNFNGLTFRRKKKHFSCSKIFRIKVKFTIVNNSIL